MTPQLLQLLTLLASLVIFVKVEPVLNLMGPSCRPPVRLAFWLLAVGSASLMLAVSQGYEPNFGTVCTLLGVACLLLAERRIRGLLQGHARLDRERRVRP